MFVIISTRDLVLDNLQRKKNLQKIKIKEKKNSESNISNIEEYNSINNDDDVNRRAVTISDEPTETESLLGSNLHNRSSSSEEDEQYTNDDNEDLIIIKSLNVCVFGILIPCKDIIKLFILFLN